MHHQVFVFTRWRERKDIALAFSCLELLFRGRDVKENELGGREALYTHPSPPFTDVNPSSICTCLQATSARDEQL